MKKVSASIVSVILCFVIALSTAACGNQAKQNGTGFEEFALQTFKDIVGSSGFNVAFYVEDKEKYDLQDVPMTWGDAGVEAIQSNETMIKSVMKQLSEFKREELDSKQQLTYDVMVDYFSTRSKMLGYEYYISDFTPIEGVQTNMLTNFVEYPFRNKQNVEDYLVLLEQFGSYIDKLLAFEAERVNKGYGMTDYAIDESVNQCKSFIEPQDNSLVAVFSEKVEEVEGLSEAEKNELIAKNKETVDKIVIPAYERIIEQLSDYKGRAKNTGGLSNYDGGKEYYEHIVKSKLGSDKTVLEVAASIDNSIQAIWTVQSDILQKDSTVIDRYLSYKKSVTPEAAIKTLKESIKENYPEYPDVEASIKPIYKSVQNKNVLGYWLAPPVDNASRSMIRYNMDATGEESGVQMFTLMAHEGYPGHLYQHAVFNEVTKPHEIRSVMSYLGYGEGWAKYVEEDSYNMLGIDDENLIAIMQLDSRISMAYVSRMEIGINYEGWGLEEAASFLKPIIPNESTVELLYNQSVADSCAFLPYYAGQLEVEELEDKTREALGDKFDLKEFRLEVLKVGHAPFSIVEESLQQYINKKLG